MKYYAVYTHKEGMQIKQLNKQQLDNRCHYDKKTNTYGSLELFDTIEETLQDLSTYSKPVKLPNGEKIIPLHHNYKIEESIFKPVLFPLIEIDPR